MKYALGLLIILQLTMVGCKGEEVGFRSVEGTERDFTVTPENPEEPQAQGPIVEIAQVPNDHKIGKRTRVVFKVIKGDFEIANVECSINKVELSCDWVLGIVNLVGMPLGLHFFEVIATDIKGLVGKAKEKWSVFDKFKKITANLTIKGGLKKTDILFVIDNSSSMGYEQSQISKRFKKFIDQIAGLDWHLGITTTDPRDGQKWGDGKLDLFENGEYFLTPALGIRKAQELFSEKVHRGEIGWDIEVGIQATYRSIERAVNPISRVDHELAHFFRDDAALAVVVVSDENESKTEAKNDGDNLIQLVEDHWGSNKIFQFNSIIVHTKECLDGSGLKMGYAYESLSKKTNGFVGDICSDNYSAMLSHLGKGVADLQKVHNLECDPQDINNDGKVDLLIIPKGVYKIPGYTIDKNQITFDEALRPGDYKFHYFCLGL